MGKRLLVQRRGRGSSIFRSPKWKKIAPARYPSWLAVEVSKGRIFSGKLAEIVPEAARFAPLARIAISSGIEFYAPCAEGLIQDQEIQIGKDVPLDVGNIKPLGSIPEGTIICNVERTPGDGGKFARAAGAYATVLSQTERGTTIISLPSGKSIELNSKCLATIGVVAGGGKDEKPKLKAGVNYRISKAFRRKYPKVRGKAMYAAAHPHGGGAHPTGGRPVKKTAPPGQKVGFFGSKRTGRKKR